MNDEVPTVSVVVPCYNVDRYIKETLDSILSQEGVSFEVVIINDGSTDTTTQILHTYSTDPRIHIITQENKGLAGARNAGLHNARGKYLCIFDADDRMLPRKLAHQSAYLDQHPQCGIVFSDCYHFIEGTSRVRFIPLPAIARSPYKTLLRGNTLNPNVVMVRRTVYERFGGFDEHLRSSEDWDYWLLLARSGVVFGYLPEVLTQYRVRAGGLSGDLVTMYETGVRVLEKQLPYVSGVLKKITRRKIAAYADKLMLAYALRGDREMVGRTAARYNVSLWKKTLLELFPQTTLSSIYGFWRRVKFLLRLRRIS